MISFIESIISAVTTPIRQLFAWFVQCLPGMRAIARWSIPFKWALLTLLFCLLIWAGAYAKHRWDITNVVWSREEWLKWFLLPIPMITGISIFVYYFVKLYLREEVSRFPDLDRIWSEGLDALEEKGISIAYTPLFLVLGTSQQRELNAITSRMGLDFSVEVPGNGSPPLSLYGCDRGVFVFLNGCNCISRLSNSSGKALVKSEVAHTGELQPDEIGGTISADQLGAVQYKTSLVQEEHGATDPFQPGGTMLLNEGQDINEILKSETITKQLSSQDIYDSLDRLRHVCKMIKRARLPVCPINGIVTTLPFELIETSSSQLQIAIQKDIAVLREEFQVRCPNTALVTGMEIEDGFIELINRLPPHKLNENRFGKGADLWVSPEAARLDAIAIHATATFEDWIYMLFQEENALKKKHNSRLFSMLCRVRGTFSENLRAVLSSGFGFDPKTQPQLAFEQFLFGGCYFAATGVSGQQAFIKSVFAKTLQQEGELEWAPAARENDQRLHFIANLFALIGTIAIVAIATMLIMKFAFPKAN